MDPLSLPPRCRKCQNPITPASEDDVLEKFGDFFRLRCTSDACGHIDWYRGVKFAPVEKTKETLFLKPPGPGAQELGEVWIHDVVLGLSFKADGVAEHNIR